MCALEMQIVCLINIFHHWVNSWDQIVCKLKITKIKLIASCWILAMIYHVKYARIDAEAEA